jgi:uncharacterized protein GlcG (DUF336 family)
VQAKLGADARKQYGEAEGLRDTIVGARIKGEDGVGIGVSGGTSDQDETCAQAGIDAAQNDLK